jgi:alanyl aminopeptidase
MTVPPGHSAFFNTPRTSSEKGPDGWTTVRFATSKPLPTYLLAFGVGPFDVVDAGTAGRNKTKIRIIVPKGKSSEAAWAVEATGPILELLEAYFDMPYPYEKLDQIAVPQVGFAMEHPGLVTYGRGILLSAPEDDTVSRRRRFASVCAHELAHMWFGDLVTMEWWDDLWLNESFATWMAAKIVDQWQPQWEWRVQQAGARGGALRADSLGSARQIRQPIISSDDVLNAFDGITYAKGRAVLWMFESWIGEQALRNGVRSYVRKHAHGNATAVDFLTELGKASNDKMTEAFLTFIEQNGVPRLDVELSCPKDGRPQLRLNQSRYVPAGAAGGAGGAQTWRIPICVRFGRGDESGRQCMLLTEPSSVMTLETKQCPDWVLPNADAAGYYHVAYDTDMLDRLFEGGGRRLTKAEQVGVAQDMRAMVASGDLAEGEALARVPVLMAMNNRHVVASASGVAAAVEEMVPEELTPAYRRFVRETFGPEARRLGWKPEKGEDEETVLLRPGLLGLVAVEGEEPELVAEARALAGRWLEDRSAIDPALVGQVLEVAARNGDEALWTKLLEQVRARPDEKVRRQLFNAMGSFVDPEIIKKNLALVAYGEFELFETVPLFFGALAEPPGREMLFGFIREGYDQLLERVPETYQAQLIYGVSAFCDEPHIDSVEAFFGPRVGDLEGGPRTLEQVLERMRVCVARREAQRASVTAFLDGW